MKNKITHFAGVDEAGRGPLAGPVAVGMVCVPYAFSWDSIPGVADSKKLTQKKREEIYTRMKILSKANMLVYRVVLIPPRTIDQRGITVSVRQGIERCFSNLEVDPNTLYVKLDGLLKAPEIYPYQETIIKGDQREKIIGLASIAAKVTRDAYMRRLAKKYPEYGFALHKGYGTVMHRQSIRIHGLSHVHRKTFCTKLWQH